MVWSEQFPHTIAIFPVYPPTFFVLCRTTLAASMPSKSSQADGSVAPRSGFKRFVVDQKLIPPRIMRYNERRLLEKGRYRVGSGTDHDLNE